jgi:hypothetical protein
VPQKTKLSIYTPVLDGVMSIKPKIPLTVILGFKQTPKMGYGGSDLTVGEVEVGPFKGPIIRPLKGPFFGRWVWGGDLFLNTFFAFPAFPRRFPMFPICRKTVFYRSINLINYFS